MSEHRTQDTNCVPNLHNCGHTSCGIVERLVKPSNSTIATLPDGYDALSYLRMVTAEYGDPIRHAHLTAVGDEIERLQATIQRLEGRRIPRICAFCQPRKTGVIHSPCPEHAGVA